VLDEVRLGKECILQFLRSHTCYDLLAKSGKVIVFDSTVPIRLAYYAFVEHDLRAAPLWDSFSQKIVGIVTMSDIADVLRLGYKFGELTEILDSHSPRSWRELVRSIRSNPVYAKQAEKAEVAAIKSARESAFQVK
jgi:CBS-domain-containing membrane protein